MNDEPVLCVLGCRASDGYPYQALGGYQACEPCAGRLRGVLDEIVERYTVLSLPAAALPRPAPGARRAPGFGSRSPANDHIIALRDTRTTAVERGDPHNALAVLHAWAVMVREERRQLPAVGAVTVSSEAATLRFEWDWITRQPWVTDLAGELRQVAGQLRNATGERGTRRIGLCPVELVDDGTGAIYLCGTELRAPLAGDTVRCWGCGASWGRQDWLRLGGLLNAS